MAFGFSKRMEIPERELKSMENILICKIIQLESEKQVGCYIAGITRRNDSMNSGTHYPILSL